MDLDKLIKRCKKQKLDAQSQLYKQYKDDLFVLCLKYCRNREEAQDNLQDSFMTIFRNIKSYNGKGSFEGWMKRITINKAIDKYKSDKTIVLEIKDVILEDTSNNENITQNLSIERILQYVQDLPSQYRLVFNLFELDNYSHKDISEILGISINTSKSNLHRAKKILQNRMTSKNKSSISYSATNEK